MRARLAAALRILRGGVPPPPPPPPLQLLSIRRFARAVVVETPNAAYEGSRMEILLDVKAPTQVVVIGEWPDAERPKEHLLTPGDRYVLAINPSWEQTPCPSN